MIWMHICQGLVVLHVVLYFLWRLVVVLKGQKAEEATGAPGVVGTCIGTVIWVLILWRSGAFSTLLP